MLDRQLPSADEVFLDHVGYFVADLKSAGTTLERLGFQVSALNVQTNAIATGELVPSGTSNRLARLRRGYLEMLAATHDTPLAAQFRSAIARYEGLHLIAMAHDDIPAQRARLTAAGFAMQPAVQLDRKDQTLPGAPRVAWQVLRPEADEMPEGRVQFTKSLTPDVLWQDNLTVHPNAADALSDMLLVVADIEEATERFSRYTARRPRVAEHLRSIDLDRGRLMFAAPAQAAAWLPGFSPGPLPYMAGQAILSRDIAATRTALRFGDIALLADTSELLLVAPQDALGSAMLFHSAGIDSPWEALAALRNG